MPSRLTQVTVTISPGWYSVARAVSESGVVIAWPATDVITSPGTMPADVAAVSHSTPRMSAPAATGATRPETPAGWLVVWQDEPLPAGARPWLPPCASSAACCCGLELLLVATSTPRNPGTPIYTVAL